MLMGDGMECCGKRGDEVVCDVAGGVALDDVGMKCFAGGEAEDVEELDECGLFGVLELLCCCWWCSAPEEGGLIL